jgi:hypothetical protein
MQNIGRAIRGEPGKTVVLIILNADKELKAAIQCAAALTDGCELPPVFGAGTDLKQLVDQADRWLEAGGGEWPEAEPGTGGQKRKGRPPTKTKDAVLKAAEAALNAGIGWREFSRKENVGRVLTHAERVELKARFSAPAEPVEDEIAWDQSW